MTASTTPSSRRIPDATEDDFVSALIDIDAANRRIRNRIAKQLGFSVTELITLFVIGDMNNVTPRVLSAETGLTTGAITSVLDRLEQAGYIDRLPHPTDRRSITLTLSFRGEETMGAVMDLYAGAIRATVPSGTEAVAAMAEHLRRVAASIDEAAENVVVPSTAA